MGGPPRVSTGSSKPPGPCPPSKFQDRMEPSSDTLRPALTESRVVPEMQVAVGGKVAVVEVKPPCAESVEGTFTGGSHETPSVWERNSVR